MIVVVDDVAYRVFGRGTTQNTTTRTGNLTAITWTSTQSSFIFTAGMMTINATFISPIEVCALLCRTQAGPGLLTLSTDLVADRYGTTVNAVFVLHDVCKFYRYR